MKEQEILQNIGFLIFYGGVIMLEVVAALYLLLRRGNAIAAEVTSIPRLRQWAAAFLFACALSHLLWIFYVYHQSTVVYTIVCGLDLVIMYPTIAGILMSMLQDQHRPVWPSSLALAPAVVLLIVSVIRGDDSLYFFISIYVILLYAALMLFMLFAVKRYGRWLQDNYADMEHKEIWQSFLILVVFLLFFIMYSSAYTWNTILEYALQIGCVVVVAIVLWRVETLQLLSDITPQEESPQPAIHAKIGPLLKKHCEDRQLYLQNDLTLAQLAQAIGTNRYYLSQHFANQGITYNSYINGLRVRHFIRLCQEAVASQRVLTAQQLAFESGFHSYSTFSAAFKQHTGKTVTAWMHDAAE